MMLCRMCAIAFLAACGDNLLPPPDAPLDAPADAAPLDATADAPDASGCWTHEYPQCGNEIYDLCVPLDGCAFYTCEGQSYGYCGPQS